MSIEIAFGFERPVPVAAGPLAGEWTRAFRGCAVGPRGGRRGCCDRRCGSILNCVAAAACAKLFVVEFFHRLRVVFPHVRFDGRSVVHPKMSGAFCGQERAAIVRTWLRETGR
jgi:hypothetical protein